MLTQEEESQIEAEIARLEPAPKLPDTLGNYVIVDGLPVVPAAKTEKLKSVLKKIFLGVGALGADDVQLATDAEGGTLGCVCSSSSSVVGCASSVVVVAAVCVSARAACESFCCAGVCCAASRLCAVGASRCAHERGRVRTLSRFSLCACARRRPCAPACLLQRVLMRVATHTQLRVCRVRERRAGAERHQAAERTQARQAAHAARQLALGL